MPDQPNILLIFTDQHKLSAVGAYGPTPCQTPNIDRLANEGLRFETAYTTCPVCSPARATIMTGLYPHSHGVTSNVHNLGCSIHELQDRPGLLSRRLESAGYGCGYSGKWHLGTDSPTVFHQPNTPSLPKDVGFIGQDFPGHGGGGFRYPEYQAYLAENGWEHEVRRVKEPDVLIQEYGILQGPVESTVPYFLAQNTIDMMDQIHSENKPFFIWHNFWGPHGPFYTTREMYDLYADVEMPKWPNYEWPAGEINRPHRVKLHHQVEEATWEDWAEAIRYYYGFTSLIDQQIGRLFSHLEQTGLSENTIVIFTADHGQTLGTHGGLVDKGWQHFEEIQRVPFIVWLPEKYRPEGFQPGTVRSEWVSLADVYPTIVDLANGEYDTDLIQGRSLAPILQGESPSWREQIFTEFFGVNALATSMISIRAGAFKYGWNCSNLDELYNLAEDPHELNNLVDNPSYAYKLRQMREMLEAWMVETGFQGSGLNMYRQMRLAQYR
jgi:arylsulfatase A-like enzyme